MKAGIFLLKSFSPLIVMLSAIFQIANGFDLTQAMEYVYLATTWCEAGSGVIMSHLTQGCK